MKIKGKFNLIGILIFAYLLVLANTDIKNYPSAPQYFIDFFKTLCWLMAIVILPFVMSLSLEIKDD